MGFPYVGDKTFDFLVKIRIFCPKKSKFGPKMAFLFILGQALLAHLVGGYGARAVPRKTPIYFRRRFSRFVNTEEGSRILMFVKGKVIYSFISSFYDLHQLAQRFLEDKR